jgi:AsmA protein
MARYFRRLTLWFLAGIATLLLLALAAVAALWWFIDPDDYRQQIQARASAAIGRQVTLTGKLRWQPGVRIAIGSEGGEIANAKGFGTQPLMRWSGLKLGVALRPLLHKQVQIDFIDFDGVQVNLERNAQGVGNWQFDVKASAGESKSSAVTLRIGFVNVRNGDIRFRDEKAGADWRVSELSFGAQLPADISAAEREFRDVKLQGKLAGGPVAAAGVPFSLRADQLQLSAAQVNVPAFEARWAEAVLSGGARVELGAKPDVTARLKLQAPSLRALLATASITPPPMNDPATLGRLQFEAALRYADGMAAVNELEMSLDDTKLTGKASLPRMEPLALRFDLAADRIDMDRYMEPDNPQAEPFELPLAMLKQLDAKGVLRIQHAVVKGAIAKDLRIDVE